LSLLALVLLCGNLAVGLSIGDYNRVAREWVSARYELAEQVKSGDKQSTATAKQRLQRSWNQLRPVEWRKRWHVWSGIAATLIILLVNSITVTYFIGTSRWCREVADAYGAGDELAAQCARLKRSNFPWAFSSIIALLVMIGFGAASDLTANFTSAERWVIPHTLTAFIGTTWIIWSFRTQGRKLAENQHIINGVLQLVREIQSDSVHSTSE
jgi:hypothetical protein